MGILELIRADIQRYTGNKKNNILYIIKTLYYDPALYSVIYFRLGQRIDRIRFGILRVFLKIIFIWSIKKIADTILGIEIHGKAKIGPGFYIGHPGSIFIGPIIMGKNCNISQEVTIGLGGQGTKKEGYPMIGDNVYFGPGAKIFGKIKIGNNVSIGANSVVSKDIPNNAIVVGNPGRIIGLQDSNPQINNKMDKEK